MDKKILTIGIPTYNNPSGVEELIHALIKEISPETKKKIEIVLSDNSTDERTTEVVQDFSREIPINYKKNEKNIGFDRNVNQVLDMANGQFCWVLSDNDPPIPSFIDRLVPFLESHRDTSYAILDYHGNLITKNDFFRDFKNYAELLENNNFKILGGLISQNIVNTEYLPSNREVYFDNNWIHLSILFDITKNNKVTVVNNGLYESSDTFSRWASNGKSFYTFTCLFYIVADLPEEYYGRALIDRMKADMTFEFPRAIASAKINGLKVNKEVLQKTAYVTKNHPLYLPLCLLILITPASFLRVIKHAFNF